jgi:hypothetical protein
VWGIIIVSVSPIVSLIGLVTLAVSSVDTGTGTSSSGGQTVGAAMGIGGLIGIALGIVLIASNSSSKATQAPLVPEAPPPPRESSDILHLPAPAIVSTPVLRF